jgi:hypothetical protein
MKILLWLALLLATLVFPGCAGKNKPVAVYRPLIAAPSVTASNIPASSSQPLIVTPAEGLSGKVSSVNANLKFVVLTFPLGRMARIDQHLSIYRAGMKVAELNVTGPQRDDSIVADITSGEAQVGDEVLDK